MGALLKNLAVVSLLLMLTACMGSARRLSIDDSAAMGGMMTDLGRAQVVFVGEFHDRRDHHQLQLQVIRELQRQGKPLAIGFEMFDLEKQAILDEWVKGKVPLQEFVERYSKGWSINWSEYDAIMLFARNNSIPMVALDAPADLVHVVTRFGPAGFGPGARLRLPAGVSTEILPSYRDFMEQAFGSHAMPGFMFDSFCAAQGLRNSTMARRIEGYLAQNPGRTMVVIAGVGHAMRRAVPAEIARSGLSTRIVIPQVYGLYSELDGDDMDYFVELEND